MSNRLTNIEMLLMVTEDVHAQGNDLAEDIRQRGLAHIRRVEELMGLLDKARNVLMQEHQRFRHYLPVAEQRMKEVGR